MHNFREYLKWAEAREAEIDKHYQFKWHIRKATREEQFRGIDRHWTNKRSGVAWSVEYKADRRTPDTGNVFVATVSVEAEGKPGWALYSEAQLLLYFVPTWKKTYRVPMSAIKTALVEWQHRYPERGAFNLGRDGGVYKTLGLCVPAREFEERSLEISTVELLDEDFFEDVFGLGISEEEMLKQWWQEQMQEVVVE